VVVYHSTGSGCVASHWLWVGGITRHASHSLKHLVRVALDSMTRSLEPVPGRPPASGQDTGIPSGQGRVSPLCEVVSKRFACEAFKRAVIDGVAVGASLKLVLNRRSLNESEGPARVCVRGRRLMQSPLRLYNRPKTHKSGSKIGLRPGQLQGPLAKTGDATVTPHTDASALEHGDTPVSRRSAKDL
jgi:hypothetical protein